MDTVKAIVEVYNSLPPWVRTSFEVYLIPLGFIFLCVEGFKTLYKKNTKNKMDWRFLFFGPWILGAGWVTYHDLKAHVITGVPMTAILYFLDVISGIGLGLASNFTSFLFEKFLNRFKKEEKKKEVTT